MGYEVVVKGPCKLMGWALGRLVEGCEESGSYVEGGA